MADYKSRIETAFQYAKRACKAHEKDAPTVASRKDGILNRLVAAENELDKLGFFDSASKAEVLLREYNIESAETLAKVLETALK